MGEWDRVRGVEGVTGKGRVWKRCGVIVKGN